MKDPLVIYADEIPTGLYPTANSRQSPFWTDGRNVIFEDASLKAGLGQISLFASGTNQTLLGIRSTIQNGVPTIYFGTKTGLFKWTEADGVTDETRSGEAYTGTDAQLWSFARFGEWMAASNGVDKLQLDTGSGFDDMDTPFDWAKVIYATDQQLIAANTSDGSDDVAWCDIDDLATWIAASDNFAGDQPQRNLASEITNITKLGSNIAVYTKNDMLGMAFIGSPFVFSILPQQEGFGTSSIFGVTSRGSIHYGIGWKSMWKTDGVTYEKIGAPAVQQFVYGDSPFAMDRNYAHLAVAWHDELQQSTVFYYTSKGFTYNNIGVSLNYVNNTWTVHNFGRSCVDNSGVFEFAISGDRLGNVYQQSVSGAPPAVGDGGVMSVANAVAITVGGWGEAGWGEIGWGGEYVTVG